MNSRSPARTAADAPVNSGGDRSDDLLLRLAVLGERDDVNLDTRLRHDKAGRHGGDDGGRGLDREMLRPDVAEVGDVLLVTQVHLRFHDSVKVRADGI
jgi:hypothetical protein